MSKSQKRKVRQTANGKLNPEEVQHLKRCGLTITNKTKSPCKRPIRRFAAWWETTAVEKFLEDVVFLLKNAALLDIINLVAGVTIIISLITWWTGRNKRWEDEIFSTWVVVKEARTDKSGVAKLALERLLKNNFSLEGIDLSKTNLEYANLQQAYLGYANLQKADLMSANLQGARLHSVNLQEANLYGANLQGARLHSAKLQGADLGSANLQQAVLYGAKLQGAVLYGANLQQADLEDVNLQEAVLIEAENLTPKQIKLACFWDKAIYKGKWDDEKQTVVAKEPDNTDYIEGLKKDKSSDPQEHPDCSPW